MRDLPIGFLDSGFGGLTVVQQSLKQLPYESVIYIGDSGRAPYGPRPLNEVLQFTRQLTNFLLEQGIKMLVIACNTATAAALNTLRLELPIPVVGVIHAGSRAAIRQTQNKRIGVIATQGTVDSHLYHKIIQDKEASVNVIEQACPLFVQIVEEQRIDDPQSQTIITDSLMALKQEEIDTLVLGCTHYPLMKNQIQKAMGPKVTLIDSGAETINEVSALLDYFNLSRHASDNHVAPATQTYYTTGSGAEFARFTQKLFHQPDIYVQEVTLKENET